MKKLLTLRNMKRLLVYGTLISFIFFLQNINIGSIAGVKWPPEPLLQKTAQEIQLEVVIVDTPELRRQGLSDTESLPQNQGMLFVFDQSARHGIWMKDMNYPIDIIWMDAGWRIIHIEEYVSPDTYPDSFRPRKPALYVLEVNAGFVKENNITKNSVLKLL